MMSKTLAFVSFLMCGFCSVESRQEPSMVVTKTEIRWAKAIKDAAAKDETLDHLSDFEYLQHAIVAKEKVSKALKRMKGLQEFRQRYGILGQGSVDDGVRRLTSVIRRHPGMFLSIGKDNTGRTFMGGNFARFRADLLKTQDDWDNLMGGFYYVFQSMQADVSSIRDGVVFVAHARGLGWGHFNFDMQKRWCSLYGKCYPLRIKEMVALDPPRVFSCMYALVKVFLSKKVQSVAVMTTTSRYAERIRTAFRDDILPPSMGGSFTEDQFVRAFESLMKRRLHYSAKFKL